MYLLTDAVLRELHLIRIFSIGGRIFNKLRLEDVKDEPILQTGYTKIRQVGKFKRESEIRRRIGITKDVFQMLSTALRHSIEIKTRGERKSGSCIRGYKYHHRKYVK